MDYERLFQTRPLLPKFGEIALSSLIIALISGIALIPGFQSPSEPFRSVSQIVNSGFFGHFIHSCHSYAGDLFLIAVFFHVLEYLLKKSYLSYHWKAWLWLVGLMSVSLFVVFSGFLTIGSVESLDASSILKNILFAFGSVGKSAANFLLLSSERGSVLTILVHHAGTFTVLTVILVYVHLKRFKPDVYAFYYAFILISLLAVAIPAKLGIMPGANAEVVKGPWYFRGLQEMLSWMPVRIAGAALPGFVILIFALLPVTQKKHLILLRALFFVFSFYLAETLIATFLRGEGWQLTGF